MRNTIKFFVLLLVCSCNTTVFANINPEIHGKKNSETNQNITLENRNDCNPATSDAEQNINNVRARLLGGGDVWWDLDNAQYVVPNILVDPVSSIFAGAVWLGGFDEAGGLKLAGQTYRNSTSNDYWPGPLTSEGVTEQEVCTNWNKFFKVLGKDIRQHNADYERSKKDPSFNYDCDDVPTSLRSWPAKGNPDFELLNGFPLPNDAQGLGPFYDHPDSDPGVYDPCNGDYPIIEVRGCNEPQFADEMIYWIYNDAGNVHTATSGDQIRMEVQVQAFAWETNDEINDMTFQRYKLINRAISSLDSAYFAVWVDADLGCFTDDYIGCDTSRSLMYIYNEDALDGEGNTTDCGEVNTYGADIPALGVDYFRGPLGPKVFGVNGDLINPSQGVIPDTIVELGMSSFTYFNNAAVGEWPDATTDPETAPEFYRYMSGSWKDGTRFSYGGSGYNLGSEDYINYAFTDSPNLQGNDFWSMCTLGLANGDRRTVQASGPFRLDPGTVNELIIGVAWVPSLSYPCPDLTKLFSADALAQGLFDNCFELTDGPTAPDIDIIELDKEIIIVLTNDTLDPENNNINEQYEEVDLQFTGTDQQDNTYNFEGYQVYQLVNESVSTSQFDDIEKARIVAQVDVNNGVTEVFNWTSLEGDNVPPDQANPIWVPEVKAMGSDEGVSHTIQILEDQFALSDKRLINHKKYFYTVIAYAHNNFEDFNPIEVTGQRKQYVTGRLNVETYPAIPRPIVYDNLNSVYGEGTIITRLDGIGAGRNFLQISDETRNAMFDGSYDGVIEYLEGAGPIAVKIYNPLEVKDGNFILKFTDSNDSDDILQDNARWILINEDDNTEILSDVSIESLNEQVIKEYGFSIAVGQTDDPGEQFDDSNGAIGATLRYADVDGPRWFGAIPDSDGSSPATSLYNYIPTEGTLHPIGAKLLDPRSELSKIGEGLFAPFALTDFVVDPLNPKITPAWTDGRQEAILTNNDNQLERLNNVDIVFTSDKSKWSRCIVVEAGNSHFTNIGGAPIGESTSFYVRDSPSVGKEDADGDGLADADGDGVGMGWFPGYAVDVESGLRLNIFFAENSVYLNDIFDPFLEQPSTGTDMMWNPTGQQFMDLGGQTSILNFYTGGQHYIYVTDVEYDGCEWFRSRLDLGENALKKRRVLETITWTSVPLLMEDQSLLSYADGLIPNDLVVNLRVDNPYDVSKYESAIDDDITVESGTGQYNQNPTYRFSFNGKEPQEVQQAEYPEALANVNVVPNPYYGWSKYESQRNENLVKITNLPDNAIVTIFSLDGKFIRQYNRSESPELQQPPRGNPGITYAQTIPDIEWDLNNSKGIAVASGVYLIHVNAPGYGERVIKWFGVRRKFDATGF